MRIARTRLALAAACLFSLASVVGFMRWSGQVARRPDVPPAPSLFLERAGTCPAGGSALRAAIGLEHRAQLLLERYPYDEADGVRAVDRFRQASRCYELSGQTDAAFRAASNARRLQQRIEADYAETRIALATSVDLARWSAAAAHVRRLARLTHHLEDAALDAWLERVEGKVRAHAR